MKKREQGEYVLTGNRPIKIHYPPGKEFEVKWSWKEKLLYFYFRYILRNHDKYMKLWCDKNGFMWLGCCNSQGFSPQMKKQEPFTFTYDHSAADTLVVGDHTKIGYKDVQ